MNKLLIIGLVLLTVGCASTSTAQKSAISLAYSSYLDGDYQIALEHIFQAEQERRLTAELQAELAYLKAQSYEEMGQHRKAEGLFEYLKEEHPNSQYGYLANKMLESSN